MLRQYIIIRNDQNLSRQKLLNLISQASSAFLVAMLRENAVKYFYASHRLYSTTDGKPIPFSDKKIEKLAEKARKDGRSSMYLNHNGEISEVGYEYQIKKFTIEEDLYEEWLSMANENLECRCILDASEEEMGKIFERAEEMGMYPGRDLFPIREGKDLICIGFPPLKESQANRLFS